MKALQVLLFSAVFLVIALLGWYRWDCAKNRGYHHGYFGQYNRVSNSLASIEAVTITDTWYHGDIDLEEFEFTVREITFMDRIEHKLQKDQRGLLVVETVNGGWAHIAGLRIKDVVMEIQGREVGSIKEFEAVMRDILAAQPKIVEVYVQRGYRTHFIFIEPVW